MAEDPEPAALDDSPDGNADDLDASPQADEDAKPAPLPVPDVGAARAALDATITLKGHVDLENNLLSEHLMRLMMRSGSGDNMPIQSLDSLEELDEVYEEVEENQGFNPLGGRTSSSRMSYNIPSPSSDGRGGPGAYRPSWMRGTHEMERGLSMEERCDIAVAETKSIQDQMNIYRQESERILDELQAAYDESELRIGEIRRDIGDFGREVMAEAAERGARVASSEHVLKFLQDRIKTTRFTIEKLRERNATLHGNIAKTEAALEIKKDLSDVLHAVDFDQLAIQKQQLEGRLRDRDKEVFRLKGENLKTEKALEKAQAQLGVLSEKYKIIKATIIERKPQLQRVKEDMAKALETRGKARDAYAQAVKDRDQSKGEKKPSVMEYLGLKKKVSDLQQIAHAMHMKVEVADLTSTQLGVKLRKAIRSSQK
ncbi:hypothetical protein M758_10G187000 [Ceratodon purpureus]|uniref:Cilia- and flagella-associated protein 263 n=1 Tax=Ceratodon purpureus TaxID=3225 RepID=A0A8T0GUI2_CERPU|nr:hypothetical protein KC19_10G191600 [Ceratodon purpureus]KAG0604665.1 hypothetical protein M758_10G187000 [Ceratodon purpureus]